MRRGALGITASNGRAPPRDPRALPEALLNVRPRRRQELSTRESRPQQ